MIVSFAKKEHIEDPKRIVQLGATVGSIDANDFSNRICSNGYFRTQHTSRLVHEFMSGIEVVKFNEETPPLTEAMLPSDIRLKVEVLKIYTYKTVIMSPRLQIAEFRGYDIVQDIFQALTDDEKKGYNLLPQDFRDLYDGFKDEALKRRVVCDFIAGMTDRYAVEFYSRLKSENPQTIFKPF